MSAIISRYAPVHRVEPEPIDLQPGQARRRPTAASTTEALPRTSAKSRTRRSSRPVDPRRAPQPARAISSARPGAIAIRANTRPRASTT
jgi:hypothetical protein